MNIYVPFVIPMVPKLLNTDAVTALQLSKLLYKTISVISTLMKRPFHNIH